MHVILAGYGADTTARAWANAPNAADAAPRRKRGGSSKPAKTATAPPPAASDRPPRIGVGSSEIVMLDGEGRIMVVNQAWRETITAYGFELADAGIGRPYVDVACLFLPDLDRPTLEQSLRRLLAGESDDERHTYAIRTARGLRWRHVQITPLRVGTTSRFVAIHDDLTDVALTQEALQVTSQQLVTAREEERQRIALELHDSTSQHLAAISLGLAKLRRTLPDGSAIIDDIAKSLDEAVKETRVLSYLMKPRGLAQNGLAATVGQFLDGFAKRTGLEVTLDADPAIDSVPPALQHAALRIVQEALLNAHRHAQPSRVDVRIAVDAEQLTVSVADDGRGMTMREGELGLGVGIPGMRARAQQFAGQLAISSDATGTRIVAALPLA